MVLIKIPICPACLKACQEEYIQNGWASKLSTRLSWGAFNAKANCPPNVKAGNKNWDIILNIFFDCIDMCWLKYCKYSTDLVRILDML